MQFLSKISVIVFGDIDKLILNSIWKGPGFTIAKIILKIKSGRNHSPHQNNTVNKEYLILKKGIIKWRIFEIKNMIFGKVKQR